LNALKAKAEKIIEQIVPFSFAAFEELFFAEDNNASLKLKELKNNGVNNRMLSDWFNNAISTLEANEQVGSGRVYRTIMNSILLL